MAVLEQFMNTMSAAGAPSAPDDIARLLCVTVQSAYRDLDLDEGEAFADGGTVTMFPTHTTAWEAVAVGPDAYQLYPGVLGDDGETIIWANVWVGENYPLVRFVTALEEELAAAAASL